MSKKETLSARYADYFTRIGDKLNSGTVLRDLPEWIARNTTLNGSPFSFKDHEFQLDILRDQAPEIDCMKCSQIGLSEIQVRASLGIASIMTGKTLIYVMPHNRMVSKFAKSRFDPVIQGSSKLRTQMMNGVDSSEMKQIGSSFILFAGAEATSSAISTPAQILIIDEYDFCNMTVLGKFSSRLRHAMKEALVRRFSTPTVSNYGIARNYKFTDKKRYFVKCLHCGTKQAPSFATSVVIPGFNKDFNEIDKDDFLYPQYKFDDAYLRCEKCGKSLEESFGIPELREWVPENSLIQRRSGYAIKPFDLIATNPTVSIIQQRLGYNNDQDYWNFVHGEPRDTDQNKVNDAMVEACTVGEQLLEGTGWYIGMDVGKICHFMVGKRIGPKRIVAFCGKIRLTEGDLKKQAIEIANLYGFIRFVIDAGPDVSLPAGLQTHFGISYVNPCVYVKPKKGEMTWYTYKDDTGVVNASRTKAFDHYVETINKGKWVYPRSDIMKEVRAHMGEMVRVETADEEGELTATWESASTSTHFFHAGFYLHLAMEMDEEGEGAALHSPVGVSGVRIGSALDAKKPLDAQSMEIAKLLSRM